MPRLIDYGALWSSDQIARCAEWAQAEYVWLYGLADAYGSFEVTTRNALLFLNSSSCLFLLLVRADRG